MANSPERHPSNHELELYLLDRLTPDAVTRIEEHYLGCRYCVGRISAAADFLDIHNVTPGNTRALAARRQAPYRIRRPARPIPWGNLAASILIVAAAANIYERDTPRASGPPLPPPVVARVLNPVVAPEPDPVTIQSPPRISRHIRWARSAHVRRARPSVLPLRAKTFQPPQASRVILEARAPGLEMPSLDIAPVLRTAQFQPPPPAAPEFHRRHNRFVRLLAAIGRHLKPKSA